MKIGIYGGAFNPPHEGHKQIVLDLLKFNYLDKVICVPVGDIYCKRDLVSFYHRIKMLEIMFNDNYNVMIDDYENKHEDVYTYQTLDYFQNLYPEDEIYFVCGSDNIKELKTWKNYEYILSSYKILAISRTGYSLEPKSSPSIIGTSVISKNVSSTEIRDDLSSKHLNNNIRKYIYEHGLYRRDQL